MPLMAKVDTFGDWLIQCCSPGKHRCEASRWLHGSLLSLGPWKNMGRTVLLNNSYFHIPIRIWPLKSLLPDLVASTEYPVIFFADQQKVGFSQMYLTLAFPFCPPGYHGLYCEEEYNECLSAPCLNAATCRDLVNGYECVCLAEYKGSHFSCSLGSKLPQHMELST